MNNLMITAKEVSEALNISLGHAYKIMRVMNAELKGMGYIVVSGKVPRAYWDKRFYGGRSYERV